jgi:hypothetical protein
VARAGFLGAAQFRQQIGWNLVCGRRCAQGGKIESRGRAWIARCRKVVGLADQRTDVARVSRERAIDGGDVRQVVAVVHRAERIVA